MSGGNTRRENKGNVIQNLKYLSLGCSEHTLRSLVIFFCPGAFKIGDVRGLPPAVSLHRLLLVTMFQMTVHWGENTH